MSSTFIGKTGNTDMPTIGHGIRVCPNWGEEVWVDRILIFEDEKLCRKMEEYCLIRDHPVSSELASA